jgi:acetyl esterase
MGRSGSALFLFPQMSKLIPFLLLAGCSAAGAYVSRAHPGPQAQRDSAPDAFVYEQAGGRDLKLYVFEPPKSDYRKPRGAVVLFHGGGWSTGSAAEIFGQARYFASLGMVGISVEYRLADGKDITPFEAVEDAKASLRWVRGHAAVMNVDPKKIAAYGESAGAHLAAATAIIGENPTEQDLNAVPNAMVLFSPALNIEQNERFKELAGAGRDVASISPMRHVRKAMPPTIILTGALDERIPATTLIDYCGKMKQAHNRCELEIYPGVGHMLEPPDERGTGSGNSSKTKYDAFLKLDQFLLSLGFLPLVARTN